MEQWRNEENIEQQQPQQRRVKPTENQMAGQNHNHNHQPPPPPQKCPRCDSSNTKFCYYNNYSLSQPRYFCKACRRYWTHGGTLRNVPIGGGCRKTKRPKPSTASSSNSEIARTHQHSLTGMIPVQSLRSLPPVVAPLGNSLYTGGAILSSLAAMQALPTRINQGAAVNLGSGQFGANMALLQGMNLQPMKPQAPNQFQAHDDEFIPSQHSLIPTRPMSSWTQRFINSGVSTGNTSFWGGTTGFNNVDGGGDQASSSFSPNQWSSNNHQGFNPSQ